MLLNLSDVLSEQHKPIDAVLPLEMEAMKLPGGPFPLVEKSSVQIHIEHVKGDRKSVV